jgi:hypothetical protein
MAESSTVDKDHFESTFLKGNAGPYATALARELDLEGFAFDGVAGDSEIG